MDVINEGIFGPIVVELCKIGRTQLLDSNTFSRDATQIALSLLSLPVGDLDASETKRGTAAGGMNGVVKT